MNRSKIKLLVEKKMSLDDPSYDYLDVASIRKGYQDLLSKCNKYMHWEDSTLTPEHSRDVIQADHRALKLPDLSCMSWWLRGLPSNARDYTMRLISTSPCLEHLPEAWIACLNYFGSKAFGF